MVCFTPGTPPNHHSESIKGKRKLFSVVFPRYAMNLVGWVRFGGDVVNGFQDVGPALGFGNFRLVKCSELPGLVVAFPFFSTERLQLRGSGFQCYSKSVAGITGTNKECAHLESGQLGRHDAG